MAESECGSSPAAFMRLKVSRQEIPASTRIRVDELCTIVLFPRLPLSSTETDTPLCCGNRSNFLTSPYLRAAGVGQQLVSALTIQQLGLSHTLPIRGIADR